MWWRVLSSPQVKIKTSQELSVLCIRLWRKTTEVIFSLGIITVKSEKPFEYFTVTLFSSVPMPDVKKSAILTPKNQYDGIIAISPTKPRKSLN